MTDTDARKIFGRNLSNILNAKHITQKELGAYMGVSSATTSDWCSGKKMPRINKLTSIANYLHVSMSDLVEQHQPEEFVLTQDEKDLLIAYRNSDKVGKEAIRRFIKIGGLIYEAQE